MGLAAAGDIGGAFRSSLFGVATAVGHAERLAHPVGVALIADDDGHLAGDYEQARVEVVRVLGQYDQPVALRTNVTGLLSSPVIVYWNIDKN